MMIQYVQLKRYIYTMTLHACQTALQTIPTVTLSHLKDDKEFFFF